MRTGPPPEPDIHARGAFLGLTQTTTPAALYRAVLEGVALQSRMMLDGMTGLPGVGEARRDPVDRRRLAQSRSSFDQGERLRRGPLIVVDEPEATALGAALFAGVAAGLFPTFDAALAGLDRKEHMRRAGAAGRRTLRGAATSVLRAASGSGCGRSTERIADFAAG